MDFDNSENATSTTISILDYVSIVWHWAWLVVLITAIAAGVVYFINSHQTPIYEATTQILVSDPPGTQTVSSSTFVTTSNSAATYSEMITASPVLQKVIDDLKLTTTTRILQANISASVVTGTQIITVSVRDTSSELAARIANKLVSEFQATIQGIQKDRYGSSIDSWNTQINVLSTQLAQAASTPTQESINSQIEKAQTNLNQITLAQAQSSTLVIQVQPAEPPPSPISPRTLFNTILAAIIAGIISIAGILAVEFLDDSIKSPDELTTKFGLPVLGVISSHTTDDNKPITMGQPRNPVSESFRALRTNIQYASVDHQMSTVIITSPTPQEGKTTVSTNLAVVLAQSGKKVMLIDADMRRPQIHERLGLPNQAGLSSLFVTSLDDLSHVAQSTGIDGLSAITSGHIPPNPSELLSSQKMAQILEKIKETYDIIIIDTPPVLSVTDAVALSTMVDGVLVVAKPGKTKLAAIKQSVEQLRRVGANLLGAVMNDVEPRSARYGYYYRQYYYKGSYYYDQKTGEKKKRKKTEVTAEVKEG